HSIQGEPHQGHGLGRDQNRHSGRLVQPADLAVRPEPTPQSLEVLDEVPRRVEKRERSTDHDHVDVGPHRPEPRFSFHGWWCRRWRTAYRMWPTWRSSSMSRSSSNSRWRMTSMMSRTRRTWSPTLKSWWLSGPPCSPPTR